MGSLKWTNYHTFGLLLKTIDCIHNGYANKLDDVRSWGFLTSQYELKKKKISITLWILIMHCIVVKMITDIIIIIHLQHWLNLTVNVGFPACEASTIC